jgi:putative Mg2+ transporter-C (MgtC) family protein
MAGLRTNALVALGAASFVAFAGLEPAGDGLSRVAAQVVSGIGFLGAGVILHQGVNIRGLNTAATLWCSAAVGVFAGGGHLIPASIASGFIVAANLCLPPLVRLINKQPLVSAGGETHYVASVTCRSADEAKIRALLLSGVGDGALSLRRLESTNLGDTGHVEVHAFVAAPARNDAALERIIGRLSLEPGVSAAKWHVDTSLD